MSDRKKEDILPILDKIELKQKKSMPFPWSKLALFLIVIGGGGIIGLTATGLFLSFWMIVPVFVFAIGIGIGIKTLHDKYQHRRHVSHKSWYIDHEELKSTLPTQASLENLENTTQSIPSESNPFNVIVTPAADVSENFLNPDLGTTPDNIGQATTMFSPVPVIKPEEDNVFKNYLKKVCIENFLGYLYVAAVDKIDNIYIFASTSNLYNLNSENKIIEHLMPHITTEGIFTSLPENILVTFEACPNSCVVFDMNFKNGDQRLPKSQDECTNNIKITKNTEQSPSGKTIYTCIWNAISYTATPLPY